MINDLIRRLVDKLRITAVTIMHEMASVRVIADHVAMLHESHVAWNGTTAELANAANQQVRQFVDGRAITPA